MVAVGDQPVGHSNRPPCRFRGATGNLLSAHQLPGEASEAQTRTDIPSGQAAMLFTVWGCIPRIALIRLIRYRHCSTPLSMERGQQDDGEAEGVWSRCH